MRIHPDENGKLTNEIHDVPMFISAWDEIILQIPRESQVINDIGKTALQYDNMISEAGNINIEGSELCSAAIIYTPSHPEFITSIEKGIRDLVLLLVDIHKYITYSSCEGHKYVDKKLFHKRYISILPRNDQEYLDALTMLMECANIVNSYCSVAEVEVKIVEVKLTSIAECKFYGAIDVVFESNTDVSEIYFAQLDQVYEVMCKAILLVASKGGS